MKFLDGELDNIGRTLQTNDHAHCYTSCAQNSFGFCRGFEFNPMTKHCKWFPKVSTALQTSTGTYVYRLFSTTHSKALRFIF